jgi:hypothetical protein
MEQPEMPVELIYPEDFWPLQNESYQIAIDEFVYSLESYMQTKAVRISLQEAWKESNRAPGVPLADYLKTVHFSPYCYREFFQLTCCSHWPIFSFMTAAAMVLNSEMIIRQSLGLNHLLTQRFLINGEYFEEKLL